MLPRSWLRINYNGKILRQWSHRLVLMSPSPWELSIVILLPTAMLHTVFNHGWSNYYQIFYLVHLYFEKWSNNAMRHANEIKSCTMYTCDYKNVSFLFWYLYLGMNHRFIWPWVCLAVRTLDLECALGKKFLNEKGRNILYQINQSEAILRSPWRYLGISYFVVV